MSKKVKLAIIGNQGVGKTTFLKALQTGSFESPMPTIAIDFLSIKDFKLEDENEDQKYTLQVFDLAGLAKNTDLVISFLRQSDGVFLAFEFREQPKEEEEHKSIEASQNIPDQIKYWLGQVMELKPQPICMIATKEDRILDDQKEDLTKQYQDLIQNVLDGMETEQKKKSEMYEPDTEVNKLVSNYIVKNQGKSFFLTSSFKKESIELLKFPTRALLRTTINFIQQAPKSKSPSLRLSGEGNNRKSSDGGKKRCC